MFSTLTHPARQKGRAGRRPLALALAAALTACALLAGVSPAQAQSGGNSENARKCQGEGWKGYQTADGRTFKNQGECISYAGAGGTLISPLELCKQELSAKGLSAPANANYILGTVGDDTLMATSGADVICGFEGRNFLDNLSAGDIFLGGADADTVDTMNGGTFYMGEGSGSTHDRVETLNAGTVYGPATGTAWVDTMNGGTFNTGEVWGIVRLMYGGTFNGGEGINSAYRLYGGTFNGGEGNDHVDEVHVGATYNGEAGDDYAGFVYGTFNGGDGNDTVGGNLCGGGTVTSVETLMPDGAYTCPS